MPAEQPFGGERLVVVLRGVEHHLDHTLDIPVGRGEGADVDAEASRDGGADLVLVQDLALDFGGLEDVFGQCLKNGLFLKPESECFHSPD